MASLWQRKKTGVWYVTYRENGKQRARSLRTEDKRESLKLKPAIEAMLDERGAVAFHVSDRPQAERKSPRWTSSGRSSSHGPKASARKVR
jgi:hypothetical protein